MFCAQSFISSAHYFVDENGVYLSVQEADTAWRCGAATCVHPKCRNANCIGIEMCSRIDAIGKYYIKPETQVNAITLGLALMAQYKIDVAHIQGIDCATPITGAVAAELVKEGYVFVCRYLVPEGYWKRLTVAEAHTLSDAGLNILCVFETTADRARGGAPNGTSDGAAAYKTACELDMPTSGYIFFAVDYDAGAGDMDNIEAYLRAVRAQTGAYKIGVYGSYAVIEAMAQRGACGGFWQTYAWSGGKRSGHAMVYQYLNDQKAAGISVDFDEATDGFGIWIYNNEEDNSVITDTSGNTPSSWAATSVEKAKAKGIIKGDENGNLKLQDPVTREQLMVFFGRLGLLD